MSVAERGRGIGVVGVLLSGAIALVASTQTWLTVTRADAADALHVAGADALPLLTPLSLAVLALGAALSIVGPVLRVGFAVLAAAAAVAIGWGSAQLAVAPPLSAVAPAVTEATGLAGDDAVAAAVAAVAPTPWPLITAAASVLLVAVAVFVLATARRWRMSGRRFQTATVHEQGPVDAVDSWDDLSRGDDPTR